MANYLKRVTVDIANKPKWVTVDSIKCPEELFLTRLNDLTKLTFYSEVFLKQTYIKSQGP